MNGLLLGFDLCDDYSQISCFHPQRLDAEPIYIANKEQYLIPTVICKKKKQTVWCVGEDAYKHTLVGEGVLVDKLVKLVIKDGSETIEGVKYSAAALLEYFLKETLQIAKEKYESQEIRSLVFCIQEMNMRLMDTILSCMDHLGISREQIHIMSRTESFMYYVLSQKKELWNNLTALYDLSDDGLHYYEMQVFRGIKPQVVEVRHEKLEEGFSLDILDTPSGGKLADQILAICGERLMQKKVFSSVLLTGRGFQNSDWAMNFVKAMASKRKLYAAPNLFAMGVAFRAYDYITDGTIYPFIGLCEGTVAATVGLKVISGGRERQLILASAGDNWYESRATVELLLEDTEGIDFYINPGNTKYTKKITIPLTGFPDRPPKTTRIELLIAFTSEEVMKLRIKDKGFGELFPKTDVVIREEIHLSVG